MGIRPQSLSSYLAAKREIESVPLGQWLKEARHSAGISQTALARSVGRTQAYISQIENGNRTPSNSSLENIIDVLDSTQSSSPDSTKGEASGQNKGEGAT